jgi:hypothetical protein
MFQRRKNKDIISGQELLRINSLLKKSSNVSFKFIIILSSLFFVVCVFLAAYYFKDSEPKYIIILFPGFITLFFTAILTLIFSYFRNKGNPLLFTDKGIAIPYLSENYWQEIESYGWDEYKGLNKLPGPTLFSLSEGICLKINPKGFGLASRWTNTRGGNIMAVYLIFFSKEQQLKAETIFNQHGVRKKS